MMICCYVKFDIKDGQILQNFGQKSSMSSKYNCVLDDFFIMLGSCILTYNSKMTYDSWFDVKFDTNDDQILQNSIQKPSMSSKYDCALDELLFILGS